MPKYLNLVAEVAELFKPVSLQKYQGAFKKSHFNLNAKITIYRHL